MGTVAVSVWAHWGRTLSAAAMLGLPLPRSHGLTGHGRTVLMAAGWELQDKASQGSRELTLAKVSYCLGLLIALLAAAQSRALW